MHTTHRQTHNPDATSSALNVAFAPEASGAGSGQAAAGLVVDSVTDSATPSPSASPPLRTSALPPRSPGWARS
eukprot:8047031-Pyramimonas_sp.AAC.1